MYSHRIFDTSCTNKSEFWCDTECDDSENSFGAIGGKEIGENLTALVHLQSLSFGWVKFYFLIKIVYVVQVLEWSPISSESSSFFFFYCLSRPLWLQQHKWSWSGGRKRASKRHSKSHNAPVFGSWVLWNLRPTAGFFVKGICTNCTFTRCFWMVGS